MSRPIGERTLRDLLLLVNRRATIATVGGWTAKQRATAEAWAVAVHLGASDNPVRVPAIPVHVRSLPNAVRCCEVCRCTDDQACEDGCSWSREFAAAGRNVCSRCTKRAKPINSAVRKIR